MNPNNYHLYSYPDPARPSSSSTRATDAFTQRYGSYPPPSSSAQDAFTQRYGNRNPRCPPPAPQNHSSLNYTPPGFNSTNPCHTHQNFNPSAYLPSNPAPPEATPLPQLHRPNMLPHGFESGSLPQQYPTASQQNNQSFPFHRPSLPSLQPHSIPLQQFFQQQSSYRQHAGDTGHEGIMGEEAADEVVNRTFPTHSRQGNYPSDPFLPDSRRLVQHVRSSSDQPPLNETTDVELANLRRANRHAKKRKLQVDLANPADLEEVNKRRHTEAKEALNWNRKSTKDGTWDCHNTIERSHNAWLERQRSGAIRSDRY